VRRVSADDRPATDRIAATFAITEVLYRYCRGLDRMDVPLAKSVWHPDGTAHYSGLYEGSGHGFVDWVMELHRPMVCHSHQITNVLVEVDDGGTTAGSEAYVTVRLRCHDAGGRLVDIVGAGRYCDRWSLRDGRWAIDDRTYVGDLTTVHPVPEGRPPLTPAAPVAPVVGQRDTDDASYRYLGRRPA
jgi:hypothetical protein